MILIERSKFALLVRSHMKASNMLLVLQHVCRERRISLSMTQEEVCQLIRLDPDFVENTNVAGNSVPSRIRMANNTTMYWISSI